MLTSSFLDVLKIDYNKTAKQKFNIVADSFLFVRQVRLSFRTFFLRFF